MSANHSWLFFVLIIIGQWSHSFNFKIILRGINELIEWKIKKKNDALQGWPRKSIKLSNLKPFWKYFEDSIFVLIK